MGSIQHTDKKDAPKQRVSFRKMFVELVNITNKKLINWKEREKEFKEILDKYRKNDGSYDVLLPGSGGKDTIFLSHVLKYKYKMNPLTITWAPHIYTDIGWHNFKAWQKMGFNNESYIPQIQ